jgi:hypothetical protein
VDREKFIVLPFFTMKHFSCFINHSYPARLSVNVTRSMFFMPFVFHVVAVLCNGTCKIRNTSQRSHSSSHLQSEMAPVVTPVCVCVCVCVCECE